MNFFSFLEIRYIYVAQACLKFSYVAKDELKKVLLLLPLSVLGFQVHIMLGRIGFLNTLCLWSRVEGSRAGAVTPPSSWKLEVDF